VLLLNPSRPTQKLEYLVALVQCPVGSVQLADTLVKLPVAAYPDQFVDWSWLTVRPCPASGLPGLIMRPPGLI